MRLDRFICKHSNLSQGAARRAVVLGHVHVNDRVEREPRYEVDRFARVCLEGVCLQECQAYYLMLNKPAGYLSATRDPVHPTVLELLPAELRDQLHIGGRLDRSTTGLLLLTNDGRWSRRVTEPGKKVPKVYRVTTARPIAPETVESFAEGIYFAYEDITTSPAHLELLGACEARLTIYEGRYHQVKRMFGHLRNQVVALHRESMGAIELDRSLAPGEFRALNEAEIASV
ncbi:16S rRNA pseudouridine(516) synthase [Marinobacterium litorale]|uniref:16S rRNA pseudouridine(516) synthase n=1 Tax=Marinobacterium litorale TaxID=404770 RepID=UPI00041D591D|nr:16S rRNA pseudouridine(516) synthase [Marinobacterium litorale]